MLTKFVYVNPTLNINECNSFRRIWCLNKSFTCITVQKILSERQDLLKLLWTARMSELKESRKITFDHRINGDDEKCIDYKN